MRTFFKNFRAQPRCWRSQHWAVPIFWNFFSAITYLDMSYMLTYYINLEQIKLQFRDNYNFTELFFRSLNQIWKYPNINLANFSLSTLRVCTDEGRVSSWDVHCCTMLSPLFSVWALWWLSNDFCCSVFVSFSGLLVSRGC